MENEKFEVLTQLIENKKYAEFMHAIDEINPVDAADFLMSLPEDKQLTAFRMLKKDAAADIFAELESDFQEKIISTATDSEIATMIDELFMDDTVDMLEELPANMVKRILQSAKPETRTLINKFLSYPEASAGSIMTTEFVDLRKTMSVGEALSHIRKTGFDKETVYVAYVTDRSRVLEGTIRLEELLFTDDNTKIEDIMNAEFVCADTHDDEETVASLISKYDLFALPVVDMEGRLVGIVTVDDAIDVIEEAATEDMEMISAITPTDKPYLKTGVVETCKKRIPWLLLLMISATFTGQIIASFETALAAFPMLIAFIPMLMGTGGNSGGQSSVTIIRGLALDEIRMKDILKVVWKEFRVAFICGLILSVCNYFKIILVDNLIFNNEVEPLSAFVVSLTLLVTVIVSKVIGCSLPIFAKRIGFDPAVMASPFITTVVDTVSLIIYFQFAKMLLGI
ncbi:MAG: magnesium transporter [Clostridia bacterium]|nr:magnesium transporter [Clostridia bacterium]